MEVLDIAYLIDGAELHRSKRASRNKRKLSGSSTESSSSSEKRRSSRKGNNNDKENQSLSILNCFKRKSGDGASVKSESRGKIVISEKERVMSGAPQSEIYNVQVLTDEQLDILDIISINQVLGKITKQYKSSTIDVDGQWFQEFDLVENIRRLVKHHSDRIESSKLPSLADIIIKPIGSLRSVAAKNGILAMQSFLTRYSDSLSHERFAHCLSVVITKTSNSPKFLSDIATEAAHHVCEATADETVARSLLPLLDHIHPNVINTTLLLLCRLTCTLENSDTDTSPSFLPMLSAGLCVGLQSKKVDVKRRVYEALAHLINNISDVTAFETHLRIRWSEEQSKTIMIDVLKKTKRTPTSRKLRSSSSRKGTAADIKSMR